MELTELQAQRLWHWLNVTAPLDTLSHEQLADLLVDHVWAQMPLFTVESDLVSEAIDRLRAMAERKEPSDASWQRARIRALDRLVGALENQRIAFLHEKEALLAGDRPPDRASPARDPWPDRCPSRGPAPHRMRCGDWRGHAGAHTALLPTGAPWWGADTQEPAEGA